LGDLRAELFDRLGDLRAELFDRLGDLRAELFDRLGDLRAERLGDFLGDFFLGERFLPDMLNFIIEHDIYYEILK
jgi:hypothetical protein